MRISQCYAIHEIIIIQATVVLHCWIYFLWIMGNQLKINIYNYNKTSIKIVKKLSKK